MIIILPNREISHEFNKFMKSKIEIFLVKNTRFSSGKTFIF